MSSPRPGTWSPTPGPAECDGPEMELYGLDIETDTTVDGLDPAQAAVVAVAVSTPWGDEVLLGDEPRILATLDRVLADLPAGVLVTWNGSAFDLPFLDDRARRAGVVLGLRIWHDPAIGMRREPLPGHPGAYRATWGAHRHLDGYRMYRCDVGRVLGLSCGLKALSHLAGLRPVEVDRSRLHALSEGQVRDYVASDARLARALVARRLPGAAAFTDPIGPPGSAPRAAEGPPVPRPSQVADRLSPRVGPTPLLGHR